MLKLINQNLRIIFIGTPEFAAIILEKLIKSGYFPIAVVTGPDKPSGRKQILVPSPVKVLAEKNKIPIFQPEKIINLKSEIKNLDPDLIILAAYGQIIPKDILDIPRYGALNIHPSLLPKYRGPSPIQTTILNGDSKTGVTIILMDEKIDHGPILGQKKIIINKIDSVELTKILAELGGDLLIEILPKYLKGEIKPKPQNHSQATYTKFIKKEDGRINWQKSAEEIERMIRAYYPWPSVFTKIKNKILKIFKVKILKINHKKEPGTVFLTEKKELAVACGQDALVLEEVQFEGKKRITAQEFINGYPWIINFILK